MFRTQSDVVIPEKIEDCGTFTGSLDVVDDLDAEKTVIVSLQGPIAARMLWLFNEYMLARIYEGRFNCFNAIHLIMGTNTEVEWEPKMEEQGEKLYVEDACRSMDAPFILQICGPGRDAADRPWVHQVLHSAFVIGTDQRQQPIVCEKDTHRRLRIVPWSVIWPGYFPSQHPDYLRAEYVKCFPAEEMSQLVHKAKKWL